VSLGLKVAFFDLQLPIAVTWLRYANKLLVKKVHTTFNPNNTVYSMFQNISGQVGYEKQKH
jgi:hypothetical protein